VILTNTRCEICLRLVNPMDTDNVLLLTSGGDPPRNTYAHKNCYLSVGNRPGALAENKADSKDDHGATKYLRDIYPHPKSNYKEPIQVDVYCVLKAFKVVDGPIAHAVKKLLCAGQRGKGDKLKDLKETLVAVQRAIDQEERG
jgi:hypothetical protein